MAGVAHKSGVVQPVVMTVGLRIAAGWSVMLLSTLSCQGVVTRCGELGRAAWTMHTEDPQGYSVTSVGGDFNGDGYPDILVALRTEGRLDAYQGAPGGTVVAGSSWSIRSSTNYSLPLGCAATEDVNGDGFDDLAVCGFGLYEGDVGIYFGGREGLLSGPPVTVSAHVAAYSVLFADVDCDGRKELLVGGRSNASHDLNFPRFEVFHWNDLKGMERAAAISVPGVGAGFPGPLFSVGDVNADGCADVVLLSRESPGLGVVPEDHRVGLSLFLGHRDGIGPTATWSAGHGVHGVGSPWSVLSLGDVNGDGFDDVFVIAKTLTLQQDYEYRVFLGRADGLSSESTWSVSAGRSSFADVAQIGDANGDGRRDLFLAGGLYLATEQMPPGPFFGSEADFLMSGAVGATGDVNRDGCDDFVVSGDGGATLYFGGELYGD